MNNPVLIACLAAIGLAGCVAIPADRGRGGVDDLLRSRSSIASTALQAAAQDAMPAQQLDADATVRLALMRNPRMQILYAQLGLAQADVYDAGRLSNPILGYVSLTGSGASKSTLSLSQRFTELLFLRFNSRVARSELLQTQQHVADEVLRLEAQARKAYYSYLGERSVAQMRARATEGAAASAQYARELIDAGNISELQLQREQAALSAAKVQQRKVEAQAIAARGELLKLLNLPMDTAVQFSERLDLPQAQAVDAEQLQTWAIQQRLDLAAMREALRTTDTTTVHTRRWRWLGGVEIGAEREREADGSVLTGPSGSLELPLFNQGDGALLRSRARYESVKAQAAELELAIRNDTAVQAANLQAAQDIVEEHRQRLVPLNERIVQLVQQQQNFMLIGAFELIETRQQEFNAYQSYLESVRDYWIAYSELSRVVGGRLPQPIATQGSIGPDAKPDDSPSPNTKSDEVDVDRRHAMSRMNGEHDSSESAEHNHE